MKREFVYGVLLLAACYGMARFCRHETGGFTVAQVTHTCDLAERDVPYPSLEVQEILKQPFTYLGKGKQCFVFQSADEKVVLKLFNDHYQTRLFWLRLSPFFPDRVAYNQKKLARTFESYRIAARALKDHTGLLYLHVGQSRDFEEPFEEPFKEPLRLIDKLGIAHAIDLNQTGFLLQKKADLVYPRLSQLLKQDRKEEAKEAITGLLRLIKARCLLGIADNDALIRTNFGFVGTTPVQIDVGPFSKNPLNADPAVYTEEIIRITASLKVWLTQFSPDLIPFLDEQLVAVLSSSP